MTALHAGEAKLVGVQVKQIDQNSNDSRKTYGENYGNWRSVF